MLGTHNAVSTLVLQIPPQMKTLLAVLAISLSIYSSKAQSIGIGTATPHASAQLDVSSTNKGLLAPRMTTAQRNAIASPTKGLLVYDTDLNGLYHYNGSAWAPVAGAGGGLSLPYEGSVNNVNPGFKVTNAGLGPAIQAVTTNEFGYALQASNTTNYGYSVYSYARSPNAIGVYALVDSSTAIKGSSANGIGVHATSTDSIAIRAAIIKGANTDPVILATHAGNGMAVQATSATGHAVYGVTSSGIGFSGVYGINNGSAGTGVRGEANFAIGTGVYGSSTNGTGVKGVGETNYGVYGQSTSGTALYGTSTSGYGLDVSGKVKISGGNTTPSAGAVLTSVDASGNAVWKQKRVGFAVSGPNANLLNVPNNTNTTVHLFTEEFDYGNDYAVYTGSSPSFGNSVFVAPATGLYHFDAALALDASIDIKYPELRLVIIRSGPGRIVAVNSEFSPFARNTLNQQTVQSHFSKDVKLLSGDIVFLEVYHNSGGAVSIWRYGADPYFSGHLVFEE
jgi:hypothetical protein